MYKIKKKYKWLVTGSSGFIGKNITKFLISENQNVIGIDTKFNIEDYNFYNLNKKNSKNFMFHKNDLSDFNFCKKITRDVDYVLHQAAKSAIDECEKKPSSAYKSNVLSFLNILKASEINNVKKFVYASSSSVYKSSRKKKIEKEKPNPISEYGKTKLLNEIISEKFCGNLKKIGLRYFNIYGEGQKFKKKNGAVIPTWINNILANKEIIIKGNNVVRDFCYVGDVVQANIKAALSNNTHKNLILNIGSGRGSSLNKLLNTLNQKFKKKIKIKTKEIGKNEIKFSVANIKLAQKIINFKPETDLKTGLEKTIRYLNTK